MIRLSANTCLRCGSTDLDIRPGMIVCLACGWCPQDVNR